MRKAKKKPVEKENSIHFANTGNISKEFLPGYNRTDTPYEGNLRAKREDYYAMSRHTK